MKAILIAAMLAFVPGQAYGHHEHQEAATPQQEQPAFPRGSGRSR